MTYKNIYVRDIYKNWCLEGINSTCNTMDKLCSLLRELTVGEKVITVGSSAGGYMAIAVGTSIGASAIYALAPQVSLAEYNKFHEVKYLYEYLNNPDISKWLNLKQQIQNYQGDLFYLYPAQCDEDTAQFNAVKNILNPHFHVMGVKHPIHGNPVYTASLVKTISDSIGDNRKLFSKYRGKVITRERYCYEKCGFLTTATVFLGSRIKRKLTKR